MLVAGRLALPAGVFLAALLAAAYAPGAQASSHGANCQDGGTKNVQLDEAGDFQSSVPRIIACSD